MDYYKLKFKVNNDDEYTVSSCEEVIRASNKKEAIIKMNKRLDYSGGFDRQGIVKGSIRFFKCSDYLFKGRKHKQRKLTLKRMLKFMLTNK